MDLKVWTSDLVVLKDQKLNKSKPNNLLYEILFKILPTNPTNTSFLIDVMKKLFANWGGNLRFEEKVIMFFHLFVVLVLKKESYLPILITVLLFSSTSSLLWFSLQQRKLRLIFKKLHVTPKGYTHPKCQTAREHP